MRSASSARTWSPGATPIAPCAQSSTRWRGTPRSSPCSRSRRPVTGRAGPRPRERRRARDPRRRPAHLLVARGRAVRLLEEVLEAHGGADRWRAAGRISARVRGGLLLRTRAAGNRFADYRVEVEIERPGAVAEPFPRDGERGVFEPGAARIETADGEVLESRSDPRSASSASRACAASCAGMPSTRRTLPAGGRLGPRRAHVRRPRRVGRPHVPDQALGAPGRTAQQGAGLPDHGFIEALGDRGRVTKPVLWHIPVSHFSEKARWALAWKGVEHERRAPLPGAHIPIALWLTRGPRRPSPSCGSTGATSATRPRSSRRSKSAGPTRPSTRRTRRSAPTRSSSRSSSTSGWDRRSGSWPGTSSGPIASRWPRSRARCSRGRCGTSGRRWPPAGRSAPPTSSCGSGSRATRRRRSRAIRCLPRSSGSSPSSTGVTASSWSATPSRSPI